AEDIIPIKKNIVFALHNTFNTIMGKSENYPLHLVVKGAAIRANRLVFYGRNPNDIKNRLRLEITYSLINE
ncbi:MAG TPA: hypothetical protein PKX15_05790, partial [Bacteroidales bacterium]|nr:hypothetical protein [Bacteroidales bacterium]